jgi:cytochrome c-type biogenesis protein CcmH/NrfG
MSETAHEIRQRAREDATTETGAWRARWKFYLVNALVTLATGIVLIFAYMAYIQWQRVNALWAFVQSQAAAQQQQQGRPEPQPTPSATPTQGAKK